MEINVEILKQFGLNANDIKIYNALLRIGRTKTGPIIKETSIASSRVYASLRHLVQEGLVSYQVKNNIKYYQAELPHDLLQKAEQNVAELKVLSHELKHFPIVHQERNETNVYEGIRGLKMAYEQHIDGLEKNESASIMVFVGSEFANSRELRKFFSEVVDRKMIQKHCRSNMIANKSVAAVIKKDRPDLSLYTIKYLAPQYTLPYALNISKKEVMISVWGESPIVFTIKNPTVIKAFQSNFDSLWAIAKK